MRAFEFHAFAQIGGEAGDIASEPSVTILNFDERAQAVGHAGRLAKKIKGPVDVAFVTKQDWSARYITTAMPSDYHSSGYRTERLK